MSSDADLALQHLGDLDASIQRLAAAGAVADANESRRALNESLNNVYTLHSWCEKHFGDAYRNEVYSADGQIVSALVFVRGQKVHDLTRSVGPEQAHLVLPFIIPARIGKVLRWLPFDEVRESFEMPRGANKDRFENNLRRYRQFLCPPQAQRAAIDSLIEARETLSHWIQGGVTA